MARLSISKLSYLSMIAGAMVCVPGDVNASPISQGDKGYIYGGEIAKTCEFPTTLYAGGCTATLIHPKVVISAGHCGKLRSIDFGESVRKRAKRVGIKWCETTSFSSTDAQICVLKEAVEGLPTAPIIQGCEVEALKAKAEVYLAGFGLDENDPRGGGGIDEKRWVATTINSVSESTLSVGGGGKGGCQGDSGGPVYIKLSDGTWRTIGATHGGGSHPNCDAGMYKRTDKLIGWYEEQLKKHGETNIDLSPCFDDAGEWKPTEACGGYTKDVQGPYGAWSDHCGEGMPVQKYSATCGEPFGPNDDDKGDDIKDDDKKDDGKKDDDDDDDDGEDNKDGEEDDDEGEDGGEDDDEGEDGGEDDDEGEDGGEDDNDDTDPKILFRGARRQQEVEGMRSASRRFPPLGVDDRFRVRYPLSAKTALVRDLSPRAGIVESGVPSSPRIITVSGMISFDVGWSVARRLARSVDSGGLGCFGGSGFLELRALHENTIALTIAKRKRDSRDPLPILHTAYVSPRYSPRVSLRPLCEDTELTPATFSPVAQFRP